MRLQRPNLHTVRPARLPRTTAQEAREVFNQSVEKGSGSLIAPVAVTDASGLASVQSPILAVPPYPTLSTAVHVASSPASTASEGMGALLTASGQIGLAVIPALKPDESVSN